MSGPVPRPTCDNVKCENGPPRDRPRKERRLSKRPMAEIGPMLECDVPPEMPVLPLMSTIVFPLGVTSLQVRVEQSKALLRDYSDPDNLIALVYSPARREQDIRPAELSKIGLAARVIRILNMPGGNVQVTLEGLRRVGIEEIHQAPSPTSKARVSCPIESHGEPPRKSGTSWPEFSSPSASWPSSTRPTRPSWRTSSA